MKVTTIVGARPQFIKAAGVSRALALAGVSETLLHTGQHFDANMSDVFFAELGIAAPKIHLGIGGGRHGAMTGRMLTGIEDALVAERPDWVLVYGDTNSTLAGALAACKLHVPIAHVEAGLRSFNRRMPEEINRVLTDHASDLLLAPTKLAVKQLEREGISRENVVLTGDVMYDVALHYGERAQQQSRILERLAIAPREYLLATIHRQENTDDARRLANILLGLADCGLKVVLPLHPRTRNRVAELNLSIPPQITVIDPVGYLDMVMLEKNAAVIATDSGGVQKEAFFYRIPCVTLREETEWVELVDLGWNVVVPPDDAAAISRAVTRRFQGLEGSPYGDGQAARRIVESLRNWRGRQP